MQLKKCLLVKFEFDGLGASIHFTSGVSKLRMRMDFLSKVRFEPLRNTFGGLAIVQSLGSVTVAQSSRSGFNRNLSFAAVGLFVLVLVLYVLLLLVMSARIMKDKLTTAFQPETEYVAEVVEYLKDVNRFYILIVYSALQQPTS